MNDPRWTTVDGLLEAALERDPQERASFLREACAGNETLRREVESLLAHAKAEDFLDRPAHDLMARPPTHGTEWSPGHNLGPYRIVDLLGRGGMGEVYRAHDTTLGRDVAIKILPSVFTTDADRRARFDREARVLAALNHAHIGAIYGVQETDGVRALVLELVEGDTLAERLTRGPISINEALRIARQIAEALEAAHDKGIVHRDLKPANIKITPQGVVKVLDFGLAKATSGESSSPDLSHSPTITGAGTRAGLILGTAAYMSPEQARGQIVDKRTDIWAFGCVLFEMLTGRALFARETITDTLAAIVDRDPSWDALPASTPPAVRHLIERCLEKDSKQRLRDIGEARIEIEDILGARSGTRAADAMARSQQRPRWSIVASLVPLILVGAVAWMARSVLPGQTPRTSRTTIAASGLTAVSPNSRLALTPDGTRVVYIGNDGTQIFVHPLNGLDQTTIFTSAVPLNWVCVSPDGRWVAFLDGLQLKKVALTGGPAETIAVGVVLAGATWAPDDTIIFGDNNLATGLQRVSASGGEVAALTRPDKARGDRDHLWPEMLPGGRAVLFTITASTGGTDAAQVAVLDLATGKQTVVVRGGSHAHYVPSGHLVYAAGGTLRAIPFDLARMETRGTPVTMLPRLVTSNQGAGNFFVAANGTLAYVDAPELLTTADTIVWVDRQGKEEALGAPARAYSGPRVSRDGMRVAVSIADQTNSIWIWDLGRAALSRLTFDPAFGGFPVWAPDGRRLFFNSIGSGVFSIFSQSLDGTAAAEALITGSSAGLLPTGVTPDGRQLLFDQAGRDLMVLALDSTRTVRPLIQTPFIERNGVVSPDGRWLAYESDIDSGRLEIYVRPFPDVKAGLWQISTDGGRRPLWAPGGGELFYVAPDRALMAVPVDGRGTTWSHGRATKVVEGVYQTGGSNSIRTYDVSPDGKRFLVVKRPADQPSPRIVVIENWLEELKARVPTL